MLDIDGDHALTLAAIVEGGTLDAAADSLHITPSAVSQRVRALESRLGRPVLRRTRPIELTDAGLAILRYSRQLAGLAEDLRAELEAVTRPRLTLVINADSLRTWALTGLRGIAERVQLEILREDQSRSLDLLRQGRASGAVTAHAAALPGCTSRRLGTMRYLGVCRPDFAERWFADGVHPGTLAAAPLVCYDRDDDLQDRYLTQVGASDVDPPRHYIPASAEFSHAVRLGYGWGVVPPIEIEGELAAGDLVPIDSRAIVDVPLYWQQWRRSSQALDDVGRALHDAAAVLR